MRSREKVNLRLRRASAPAPYVHVPLLSALYMIKAARSSLSALSPSPASGPPSPPVAACPATAVATVDGESIDKSDFSHWMNVAAKSSGQAERRRAGSDADYAKCVAAKRKTTPAPAKGQPKVTDAQLKTQCKQEYDQLRNQVLQLLISFKWIQGEADAMNIKVTDAEVKKSFDEQKKQSFPKDADYQKFLKTSGQTRTTSCSASSSTCCRTRSATRSSRARTRSPTRRSQDFYNKNKARFAQPEKRDLRVVLTKDKAEAEKAKAALKTGESWKSVAKKYSIDDTSKAAGGKLPGAGQGHARQGARRRRLLAPRRTSSSARSRPSTATTSSSSTGSRRPASRRSPRPRRRSSRRSSRRTSRRRWTPS